MSRPAYRINPALLESLHRRGLTVEGLAQLARTGRCHATQVLANKPGRGFLTRRRLAPHLTPEERSLVGWSEAGDVLHVERSTTPILDSFRRNNPPDQHSQTT